MNKLFSLAANRMCICESGTTIWFSSILSKMLSLCTKLTFFLSFLFPLHFCLVRLQTFCTKKPQISLNDCLQLVECARQRKKSENTTFYLFYTRASRLFHLRAATMPENAIGKDVRVKSTQNKQESDEKKIIYGSIQKHFFLHSTRIFMKNQKLIKFSHFSDWRLSFNSSQQRENKQHFTNSTQENFNEFTFTFIFQFNKSQYYTYIQFSEKEQQNRARTNEIV